MFVSFNTNNSLAFMITLYCGMAAVVISILLLRRRYLGGELGGARTAKVLTTMVSVSLWVVFVLVNAFEAYDYITVF